MSKTKKILLFVASGLLILTGIVYAAFAIKSVVNTDYFYGDLATKVIEFFNISTATQNSKSFYWILRGGVSLVMSSAVISFGFAAFTIRFALYPSQEFANKRSVLATMAIISIILINPIIGGFFLYATLMKDENYVPVEEPDVEMDVIEVKLKKLKELKEKDLITQEEFEKLRADILNAAK